MTPKSSLLDKHAEHVSSYGGSTTTRLTLTREDVLSLRAKWKEAVSRWEGDLIVNKYKGDPIKKAFREFQSWEDLIVDLRNRQENAEKSVYHGLIDQVYPCLRKIDKLFPLLVVIIALPGNSREMTLVWTVIYLGIKVQTRMIFYSPSNTNILITRQS
jgi:hypothetical protein